MKTFRFALLVLTSTLVGAAPARAYFGAPGTQVPVKKSASGGSPYGFYEYVPQGYSDTGSKKYPIVLFLHGLGEQGDGEANLSKVIVHGPSKLIRNGRHFDAIVVSPQSPTWWNANTINQYVDYLFRTYRAADPERLYVTGLSMGGAGTWEYATAYASRVAAAVPICGAAGGNATRAKLYGMPIWAFHAFNDTTVGLGNTSSNVDSITPTTVPVMNGYPYGDGYTNRPASTDMIALYSRARDSHQWYSGGTTSDTLADTMIRMTVYKTGGHDSWTPAYNNDDMWNWLFRQRKSGVIPPVPTPTPVPTPVPTPTPTPTPPPSAGVFRAGSVTIDFGSGSASANVNLMSNPNGGSRALVNQSAQPTTATITIVKGFNAINSNGTNAPAASTGFDAKTARDSFFGNDRVFGGTTAPSAQIEISQLDPTIAYDFRFFASRMGAGGDNRSTSYKVTGASTGSAALNASENAANVVEVRGIRPNGNGRVVIDVSKGAGNTNAYGFYYLNGLRVTAAVGAPPTTAKEIRVDFGDGGPALPAGWNDGRGLASSGAIALKTSTGEVTPYDLATITRFNAVNPNGTNAPAAALGLPAATSVDSFFGNDVIFAGMTAPKAVLEIRDLDPSRAYRFEFFASRMGVSDRRDTLYRVIGSNTVTATLDAANNTSRTAVIAGARPNSAGVLRIEIQKGAGNTNPYGFYYLGNFRITY